MLISNEENYYLVAYDEAAEKIKHYRVDNMSGIKVLKESRLGEEQYKDWNPAEYMSRTFGMYGGHTEDVSLVFPAHLIGVVIDRFGKDISIRTIDGKMKARVKVAVSPPFFGWLAGIGKEIQIQSPESVRTEYTEWLETLLKEYK